MSAMRPTLLQWWAGHVVALAGTHPLSVHRARALAWAEGGETARVGRQCFIEQHGTAVFCRGMLWPLALSLPVVAVFFFGCNLWDVRSLCSPLSGCLVGCLVGLLRAPSDHALVTAQLPFPAPSWLSLGWLALCAVREAVVCLVYCLLLAVIPVVPNTSNALLVALPSLLALAVALVAVGPLEGQRIRLLAPPRPPVIAIDTLDAEQGGSPPPWWTVALGPALGPRLLHGVLLHLVTIAWAFFLDFVSK